MLINYSIFYFLDNSSAIIRNSSTLVEQTRLQPQPVDQRIQNSGRVGEEIPESVTAELEKLEEEGGTIGGEADEVSAIFSGLVEDDDELLGNHLYLLIQIK